VHMLNRQLCLSGSMLSSSLVAKRRTDRHTNEKVKEFKGVSVPYPQDLNAYGNGHTAPSILNLGSLWR